MLVVIGIHSAKFNNEKDAANLRKAVLRHELVHPVANDSDFTLWNRYGVRGWPTLVLIDPEGNLIGGVSGEGHFDLLDRVIAQAVEAHEKKGTLQRGHPEFPCATEATGTLAFPGKLCGAHDPVRLFVADSIHHRILEIDPAGKVLAVIGSGRPGHDDGDYAAAAFFRPQGLAWRPGTLFVADTDNHMVRAVDLATRRVATIAGTGEPSRGRFGGRAQKTALSSPWDLALDQQRLFIAMAGVHQIWVLDLGKGTVVPYAGSGREDIVDGPLEEAAFAQPSGLALGGGSLFVADSEVSGIRAVDLDPNGLVATVVGEGLFEFGDRDGRGAQVRLQHPLGCAWHEGKLFVADTYNHKIKVVDPGESSATTFAGDGTPGRQDGIPARFHEPGGLAVLEGKLYIADTNNHAIRVCDLATREVATLALAGTEITP